LAYVKEIVTNLRDSKYPSEYLSCWEKTNFQYIGRYRTRFRNLKSKDIPTVKEKFDRNTLVETSMTRIAPLG